MIDPKDRHQQGVSEGLTASAPLPVPSLEQPQPVSADVSQVVSSDVRPQISQELSELGVSHGPDSFKLAEGVHGYSHNPPLRSLPGGLAYTPEELEKKAKAGIGSGSGWIGNIGEKELKKAA